MAQDNSTPDSRLTELRVQGLRSLEDVRLKLDGLTVLIGENGSGKSSLIEALELLRLTATDGFHDSFWTHHGGTAALLRQGSTKLTLGVRFTGSFGLAEYSVSFSSAYPGRIAEESLKVADAAGEEPSIELLQRDEKRAKLQDQQGAKSAIAVSGSNDPRRPAPSLFGFISTPPMSDLQKLLRGLDVHLAFHVRAAWADRSVALRNPIRDPSSLSQAQRLERLGFGLANIYHALLNGASPETRQRTIDLVRLGLGPQVELITTPAAASGGQIALALKVSGLRAPIYATDLSDGELSYLAMVSLHLWDEGRELLAFDEPETHLHPNLLSRVVDLFEACSRRYPVVVATHSDRILDDLAHPEQSVVLCELDDRRATKLVRPDKAALASWLESYRGLGEIRGAGHVSSVMTRRDD